MNKSLIALSLVWLFSGAVSAQQSSATGAKTLQELGAEIRERQRHRTENPEIYQARTDVEMKKYLRCSEGAAGELDDAISDVSTIALGIQSYCGADLDALVTASATPRAVWISALHPQVVATILARRVKLRKAGKKI